MCNIWRERCSRARSEAMVACTLYTRKNRSRFIGLPNSVFIAIGYCAVCYCWHPPWRRVESRRPCCDATVEIRNQHKMKFSLSIATHRYRIIYGFSIAIIFTACTRRIPLPLPPPSLLLFRSFFHQFLFRCRCAFVLLRCVFAFAIRRDIKMKIK